MQRAEIYMKDGTVRTFVERGRAGGSYTIGVRYEGVFVIVYDEWHNETAYPAAEVLEVKTYYQERTW